MKSEQYHLRQTVVGEDNGEGVWDIGNNLGHEWTSTTQVFSAGFLPQTTVQSKSVNTPQCCLHCIVLYF